MNRALRGVLRQLGTTLFTTACYFIVDVARGRISFANAGHPSPLLVHGADCEVEPITARRTGGPALGLFEDVRYSTQELPVAAGDLILAFTDGLFEAENANAEAFSITRLRDAIHSRKGLPLDQLMQEVFSEIKSFANGQLFSDDVCFVGVEITRIDAGLKGRRNSADSIAGAATA